MLRNAAWQWGLVAGSDAAPQCCAVDVEMVLREIAGGEQQRMRHAVSAEMHQGLPSVAAVLQDAVG